MLSDELSNIADTIWATRSFGSGFGYRDMVNLEKAIRDVAERVGELENTTVPADARLSDAQCVQIDHLRQIAIDAANRNGPAFDEGA